MKRILAAVCAVSMFFTGCSPLSSDNRVDVEKVAASVEETGQKVDTDVPDTPDFYKMMEQRKYQEGGILAFQFPELHSDDAEDIDFFQVVDLIDNRKFVYVYETALLKKDGGGELVKTGKKVHALAVYEFGKITSESGGENPTSESGEGVLEVLYEQTYEGDQQLEHHIYGFTNREDSTSSEPDRVFIHDGKYACVYRIDGQGEDPLVFKANIMDFVEKNIIGDDEFKDYESFTITNVVMDGDYRIYIELALEEEEVEVNAAGEPLEDPEVDEDDDSDGGVKTMVLVYHYLPASGGKMEEAVKTDVLNRQINEWKKMANGNQSKIRDAEADWEKVTGQKVKTQYNSYRLPYVPMEPGTGYEKGDTEYTDVYRWKSEESIKLDGQQIKADTDKASRLKDPDSFTKLNDPPTEVTAGYDMSKCFVHMNGKYYRFHGAVDTVTASKRQISRTYTLVTGSGDKKVEEEIIDYISVPYKWTVKFEKGTYLEGYWFASIDEDGDINSVAGGRNGNILAMKQQSGEQPVFGLIGIDGEVVKSDGQKQPAMGDILNLGMLWDGADSWLFCGDESNIYMGKNAFKAGEEDWRSIDVKEVDFEYEYNPLMGTDKEEERFSELLSQREEMNDIDVYGNADHFTRENLLVSQNGDYLILTTVNSGVVCAGLKEEFVYQGYVALQLFDGTFYQSWRVKGSPNKYLTIGFLRDGTGVDSDINYTSADIAHARLYQFELEGCLEVAKKALDLSLGPPLSEEDYTESEAETEGTKSLLDKVEEEVEATSVPPETKELMPSMDWSDEWEDIESKAEEEKESRERARESSLAEEAAWMRESEEE